MRTWMPSALLLAALAGASRANDSAKLEFLPAEKLAPHAKQTQGPAGEAAIEVAGGDKASTTTLVVCENPEITSHEYAVHGRVKYDGVVGDGYLELWSDFGDKGAYFSRSLSDEGWMKKLAGTSDWREFELPFYAEEGMKPRRLTLNVVLPGAGTVFVSEPLVVTSLIVEKNEAKTKPAQGPAGEPAVEMVGDATRTTTTLKVWDNPAINSDEYVVRGRVKYDGVVGDGYLELWSDFGDKGKYFSRGLDDQGTMKKLTGASDWRDFELPFYAEPGMRPRRLTLNVVLPGAGTVIVSESLVVASLSTSNAWWTERQAGLLGGVLGTLFGALGALIGVSASWGKSRTLTLTFLWRWTGDQRRFLGCRNSCNGGSPAVARLRPAVADRSPRPHHFARQPAGNCPAISSRRIAADDCERRELKRRSSGVKVLGPHPLEAPTSFPPSSFLRFRRQAPEWERVCLPRS